MVESYFWVFCFHGPQKLRNFFFPLWGPPARERGSTVQLSKILPFLIKCWAQAIFTSKNKFISLNSSTKRPQSFLKALDRVWVNKMFNPTTQVSGFLYFDFFFLFGYFCLSILPFLFLFKLHLFYEFQLAKLVKSLTIE